MTGKNASFPQFSDWLNAGKISDQTDAAIIIPDEKPEKTLFSLSLTFRLKRNTRADPKVVIKKMKLIPKIVITVLFTFSPM